MISHLGGSYEGDEGGGRDGDEDMSGNITMTESVGDIVQVNRELQVNMLGTSVR